jgi:hypothetical protein
MDCIAAALALEHRATLVTSEGDFEKLGVTYTGCGFGVGDTIPVKLANPAVNPKIPSTEHERGSVCFLVRLRRARESRQCIRR